MRDQVNTLEKVYHSLQDELAPPEDEDDVVIAQLQEFLDPDEHRLREFLRQSLKLSQDAKVLKEERAALMEMLRRSQNVARDVRAVMALRWADWDEGVDHWNAVTHAIYDPWFPEDIEVVIKDSLQAIHRFSVSTDRVSTGQKFMGWSDSRRLDAETARLQFSFSKAFVHTDAKKLFESFWDMQFSGEKLRRYNLGYSTKLHVEVLQRVSSDSVVVRRDAQYSGIPTRFHTVLLMFRQQTPTGYMACMRTIPVPSIQNAIESDAAWMNQFHWTHIDAVPDDKGEPTGCRLSFCGSISSENATYAHRWMLELAMVLVRGENTMIAPRRIEQQEDTN